MFAGGRFETGLFHRSAIIARNQLFEFTRVPGGSCRHQRLFVQYADYARSYTAAAVETTCGEPQLVLHVQRIPCGDTVHLGGSSQQPLIGCLVSGSMWSVAIWCVWQQAYAGTQSRLNVAATNVLAAILPYRR
eukprot:GHVU01217492.1.p2 GENE.GHVU01217492.1~~GHVU01217492.1.p2  ORF type:complete len:133 (+),score=4.71 GHVU01217492.1:2440-2838(+)